MTRSNPTQARGQQAALISAVLILVISPITSADWSDNFDGGLQQAWIFSSISAADGVSPSPTFTAGSVSDRLQLTDPTTILSGGAVTAFGVVPEPFTDVSMTGTLNPDNNFNINDVQMLLARGDVVNSTFYALELDYTGAQLIIYRSDGVGVGTNLVTSPFSSEFTDSYYVEFDVEGINLDARVFDMAGGTLLASASATDSMYAGGLSGVLTTAQNGDITLPLLGVFDDLTASAISTGPNGDFNGDSAWNCTDIDALTAEIVAGTNTASFDMNGDGVVNADDISDPTSGWLTVGGANHPAATNGNAFIEGDANLDGFVDVSDRNLWNGSKFTSDTGWCGADFNSDGFADVSDLNIWNTTKFQSSGTSAVPEPGGLSLCAMAILFGAGFRHRKMRQLAF